MKTVYMFFNDCKVHDGSGVFRSYDLETDGATLDECLENAVYWQVDQDGGSLGMIEADDDRAIDLITREWNKKIASPVK